MLRSNKCRSQEELDMLQETNVPAIQRGVFIIRELSEDEQVRERARRREIALRDEQSALGNARRSGIDDILASLRAVGVDEETLAKAVEDMRKRGK